MGLFDKFNSNIVANVFNKDCGLNVDNFLSFNFVNS